MAANGHAATGYIRHETTYRWVHPSRDDKGGFACNKPLVVAHNPPVSGVCHFTMRADGALQHFSGLFLRPQHTAKENTLLVLGSDPQDAHFEFESSLLVHRESGLRTRLGGEDNLILATKGDRFSLVQPGEGEWELTKSLSWWPVSSRLSLRRGMELDVTHLRAAVSRLAGDEVLVGEEDTVELTEIVSTLRKRTEGTPMKHLKLEFAGDDTVEAAVRDVLPLCSSGFDLWLSVNVAPGPGGKIRTVDMLSFMSALQRAAPSREKEFTDPTSPTPHSPTAASMRNADIALIVPKPQNSLYLHPDITLCLGWTTDWNLMGSTALLQQQVEQMQSCINSCLHKDQKVVIAVRASLAQASWPHLVTLLDHRWRPSTALLVWTGEEGVPQTELDWLRSQRLAGVPLYFDTDLGEKCSWLNPKRLIPSFVPKDVKNVLTLGGLF